MTRLSARDPRPRPDTSICEQEPIHAPGAIQPHGALLVVDAESRQVTHASANLQALLDLTPAEALGRPLSEAIGAPAAEALLDAGRGATPVATPRGPYLLERAAGHLHLQAHRTGRFICIDIEPQAPPALQVSPISLAQSILETFRQATTPQALCELAVSGLRRAIGYDRVMAYRFAADEHGEVIAEDRATELDPYLGLHYPADDIPAQARRHYLRQRVGAVPDAGYVPVPLIQAAAEPDPRPLDLTYSALRSVSPHHRQYMRNMGTAASLTVGLASGQHLWGMLVCHHRTPRIASPELRATADLIGTVVSLLLFSLADAERDRLRQERGATLRRLIDSLAAPGPLHAAFGLAEAELLAMVGAGGAVVSLGGVAQAYGRTPPLPAAERALASLQILGDGAMVAVEDLGRRVPALADCAAEGSGALLLPLARGSDDAILWFRPELTTTVTWGGDPTKDAGGGLPSPRTSFAAWKQTITGRSAAWSDADLALAADLRGAVEAQIARRTRIELTALQNFDRMVGQPNRQRELERSNAALEEFAYAASHDLKAPLRAIGHLSEWIAEDIGPTASADTRENLALLQGRVARRQSLLDGLLAYSRAGRETEPSVETIDIAAMVDDIVATLAPPPGFRITCEAGLPPLHAHRIPLGIVLTNLIGNAVAHHDRTEGWVTVGMTLAGGLAEFRVTDDGPGIPARFHERIFQIFQTLASRDEVEASGIGLAIVRKHVQANGGTIWVESAPPRRGAVFAFTWVEATR